MPFLSYQADRWRPRCHWSFTRSGLVRPKELYESSKKHPLTTQTDFMEIIYPFEAEDDFVLNDMIKSTDVIKMAA
jgi:hypothetical protein